MLEKKPIQISRRTFLHEAGLLGGGAFLAGRASGYSNSATAPAELPRRVLGRTQQEVTALALGTWPCGKCDTIDTPSLASLVSEALDLGINYIDAARAYGNAEEGIGRALGKRRDQVFLASKVWADTADEARESLETSLRTLRTDRIDLVYLHSMGNRNPERIQAKDGALTYLLQQKKAGNIRFIGISGHSKVPHFIPVMETGQIDVVLMAMNFVDRHIYGFEEKVLPVARRLDMGVACMKVFGGLRGGFGVAAGPNPGPEMEVKHLEQAVRYALGLPGVATVVIGPHTIPQLRQNVQWVKNYKPLSDQEQKSLLQLGKQLAQQWGPHYGPVA